MCEQWFCKSDLKMMEGRQAGQLRTNTPSQPRSPRSSAIAWHMAPSSARIVLSSMSYAWVARRTDPSPTGLISDATAVASTWNGSKFFAIDIYGCRRLNAHGHVDSLVTEHLDCSEHLDNKPSHSKKATRLSRSRCERLGVAMQAWPGMPDLSKIVSRGAAWTTRDVM